MVDQNIRITARFTRPANTSAYASGDQVSNSTSAASSDYQIFPLPQGVRALKAKKLTAVKSTTNVTNAVFRLHLLSALPTANIADNDVLSTLALASSDYYIGYFDFTYAVTLGGFALVSAAPAIGAEMLLVPDANTDPADTIRNCYGVLEARGAYTPGSQEVFTLTIEGETEISEG